MTSETTSCVRVVAGVPGAAEDDRVAVEAPFDVRIDGQPFVVTMRTPGHDEELALGLLFAEGIVRAAGDASVVTADGVAEVTLAVTAAGAARGLVRRGTLATGACGVCGRETIDDLLSSVSVVKPGAPYDARVLQRLTEALRAAQPGFAETGGLHAAGVADRSGALLVVREDVGRHNAVDKVVGRLLLEGRLPGTALALVVSGRVSFELVQKAAAAGIPLIAGVSAPSSLAIETAQRARVTLVGFARGPSFNVYTHADGIAFETKGGPVAPLSP